MTRPIHAVRVWAEMVKLWHSVFALPFALTATFLAGRNLEGRRWPHLGQLGLILLCMVAARSTAMTFNRIVDAAFDARNPRTAMRPLPAGRLTRAAAVVMLILSALTFGIGCLGFHIWYANSWPILFSGPVLLYLCGYSFTKRFTRWSHFYLGSAIAVAPVAAWLAIHPSSLGWPAVCLMFAVTGWIGGFDIIYAFQDVDIDRRENLHSLPSRSGPRAALWYSRLAHTIAVAALIALGLTAHLGFFYAAGVTIAALILLMEHLLVRPDDPKSAALAFNINAFVSLTIAATAIADLLLR